MNNIKDIVKKDSVFLTDSMDVFLSERLEKITMAVYLVTEFFPEGEPLKNKIREKGIELLSFTMSFKNSKTDSFCYKIISLVSEIESLLKIAFVSKKISEMNYSILSQEYKKITDFIKGKNSQRERFVSLKDFFNEDAVVENDREENKSKGHPYPVKDIKSVKDISISNPTKNKIKKTNISSKAKIDRKELIIKFIKDKKEVSIKDILKDIKNCSEKTIQRDLVHLVEKGVLKKKGERRWSRYSLK
ncbi:DeoR family transcriptional regulator [Patescibacteria group bacterium]|nr:DeoR family transcriptional regulator [Patescibacteria group bacterium]